MPLIGLELGLDHSWMSPSSSTCLESNVNSFDGAGRPIVARQPVSNDVGGEGELVSLGDQ